MNRYSCALIIMANEVITPSDPRYPYLKYQNQTITVARLDQLADFVLNTPGASTFSQIVAFLKVILVFAFLEARAKLVAQAVTVDEHELQVGDASRNQHEVDQDVGVGKK